MVFPSRPEGEGMPGVLIEAALSGLPVVATAVPGVALHRAGRRDRAWWCRCDDLEAMVCATADLVEDGRRRRRLGQAGRQRGVDHFSLDAVGRVWMDLLRPLLDQAARTRRPRR